MWFDQFRCGGTSTSDAESSGRFMDVATNETVEKVVDMVLQIGNSKVLEITEA